MPAGERTESLVPVAGGAAELHGRAVHEPFGETLRPRGTGAILDVASDLLRARFLACGGIAFAVGLGGWTTAEFVLVPAWLEVSDPVTALLLSQVTLPFFHALVLAAAAPISVLAAATMRGHPVTLGAAVRRALRRAPALAFASAPLLVAELFIPVCCVLPAPALWCLFFPIAQVAVLDRVPLTRVFARSFELTLRPFSDAMALAALTLAFALPFAVFTLSARALSAWIAPMLPASLAVAEGLRVVLSSFFLAVPTAFVAIVQTVFYLDRRMRRDGLDLLLRLETLGGAA